MIYKFITILIMNALFSFANADVRTHEKGDMELFRRLFEIDESFSSSSYISISIKEEMLFEFKKNECKVFAEIKYVLNQGTGFSVQFDKLDPGTLPQQKFNVYKPDKKSVIAVLYGNNTGSCNSNRKMIRRHGYFFYVSEILSEFNFEAPHKQNLESR